MMKLLTNFINESICRFGIPDSILTDQGADFTSELFKEIARLSKLKQIQNHRIDHKLTAH